MYHIALCDDDLHYIEYLKKLLIGRVGMNSEEVLFYEYTSGEELVSDFKQNIPYHLLILDMEMKQLDGDDTAREFRRKYPEALLVFCSGERQPTVKSFEANAYRYLLKSYGSDELSQELEVIIAEMKKRETEIRIAISYRKETRLIKISDILYVTTRKNGSSIYKYNRAKKEVEVFYSSQSISSVYSKMDKNSFIFAHNSYFVNLKYVTEVIGHQVGLIDETKLSISRSKEKAFKTAWTVYLARKY